MNFEKRCTRWIVCTVIVAIMSGSAALYLFMPENHNSIPAAVSVIVAALVVILVLGVGAFVGASRMSKWLDEDPKHSAPTAVSVALAKALNTLEQFTQALQKHQRSRF